MAISDAAVVDRLGQVPLFSACSRRELQRVAREAQDVAVPEGELLVDQGRVGDRFFLIVEGEAEVRREGEAFARLGPGDHFGELALLDRGPRTASVVATTDMRLVVIDQRHFDALLDEVPAIARSLLTALARRLRETDTKLFSH